MKKYHEDAKCCKCGGTNIRAEYLEAVIYDPQCSYARLYRSLNAGKHSENKPERIKRTCEKCDYQWHEAPLDIAAFDKLVGGALDTIAKHLDMTRDEVIKKSGIDVNSFHTFASLREYAIDCSFIISSGPEGELLLKKVVTKEQPKNNLMGTPIEVTGALKGMFASTEPRPVIEVGSVVEKCGDRECNVLAIGDGCVALHCLNPVNNPVCACYDKLSHVIFIRKSPKVHRFEGIKIEKNPVRPGRLHISKKGEKDGGFTLMMDIAAYLSENQNYTLTFTEEEEDKS